MDFDVKDLLEAVGPNASLIFAAWIFLSFLQQRYTAAYERYRALVQQSREHEGQGTRERNVKDQVALYKRRCEQMRLATNIGVVSAMLLIGSLICAGVMVVFPEMEWLKVGVAAGSLIGLALVIASAAFVLRENSLIQVAIDSETSDLKQGAGAGQRPQEPRPRAGGMPYSRG